MRTDRIKEVTLITSYLPQTGNTQKIETIRLGLTKYKKRQKDRKTEKDKETLTNRETGGININKDRQRSSTVQRNIEKG